MRLMCTVTVYGGRYLQLVLKPYFSKYSVASLIPLGIFRKYFARLLLSTIFIKCQRRGIKFVYLLVTKNKIVQHQMYIIM